MLQGGLSSMVFLPYISEHFDKQYIVPLYIGESISSSIPSLIVFFQGSSDHQISCQNFNQTNNASTIQIANNSNFSVSTFFLIVAVLMFIFFICFILIDTRYADKKAQANEPEIVIFEDLKENENFLSANNRRHLEVDVKTNIFKENKCEKFSLISISFFIAFFMYGVLPGIQSYSTLPYGELPFHLSINLGNLLLPIAVFTTIFSFKKSIKSIIFEFVLGILFSFYLVFISLLSPCPPLVKTFNELGSSLAVFSWILIECAFIRLRCKIAERLEKHGNEILLVLGFFTLLGQIIGGTIIFICVDTYTLFNDKPICATDFSYCK